MHFTASHARRSVLFANAQLGAARHSRFESPQVHEYYGSRIAAGSGVGELDFTKRFSAEHLVPEPEHNTTGAVIKALDALLLVDVALEGAGPRTGTAAEQGCGHRVDSVTTCIIAAWRPRAWSSWAAVLAVWGLRRRCA